MAREPRPARRLRVLVVYDCIYPEAHGGVEHRNFEMAAALARRGHRMTLAGWASRPSEPAPGVSVAPLPLRADLYDASGRRRLAAAARLAAAVARLDLGPFDLVETANIPYLHLPVLALRCRRARRPLMVAWYEYWGRYWRSYLGGPLWPLFAAFERLCAPLGAGVNAISSLTAERLQQGRRRGEVPVVPSGIPVERIRAAAATGGSGPPLVYAGRLQREKRLDLLLEAARRIPWRQDSSLLALIGDGPDRERLERRVAELGLGGRVVFRGRLASSADVWRELGRAQIAVQPSSREGFGLFPLEAMAAGLPVVYCESQESAVAELVTSGREGLASAPTAEALAAALTRLLEDPAERARLAANAANRAREYDWDRIAVRVETLYGELLTAHGSSR